jgi:hypothetical protein
MLAFWDAWRRRPVPDWKRYCGPRAAKEDTSDSDELLRTAPALLLQLRSDPSRPSLTSVQAELAKLELIRRIGLPADLFDHVLPHELERYRRRVAVEAPYELRRHPEAARLTWLAVFVHLRGRGLTDDLVDLLTETIHHIGARAERRVDRELLDDLKRVTGKQNLLFELAGAALDRPDGIVREVVFPVVGEQTLRDLVKEWKATGPTYRTTLRTVIRNSYKGHFRRMVPQILQTLDFRSNNKHHRPVIQALDLVKRYAGTKLHTFPAEEKVPIDGVARGLWREAVVERDAEGRSRVNRITYEICVLEALRDELRCRDGNRSAVSFGRNRTGKEGRSSQVRFGSGHDLGSNSRFRSPISVATLTRRAESPPRRDRTLGPRSVSRRLLNPKGELLLNQRCALGRPASHYVIVLHGRASIPGKRPRWRTFAVATMPMSPGPAAVRA